MRSLDMSSSKNKKEVLISAIYDIHGNPVNKIVTLTCNNYDAAYNRARSQRFQDNTSRLQLKRRKNVINDQSDVDYNPSLSSKYFKGNSGTLPIGGKVSGRKEKRGSLDSSGSNESFTDKKRTQKHLDKKLSPKSLKQNQLKEFQQANKRKEEKLSTKKSPKKGLSKQYQESAQNFTNPKYSQQNSQLCSQQDKNSFHTQQQHLNEKPEQKQIEKSFPKYGRNHMEINKYQYYTKQETAKISSEKQSQKQQMLQQNLQNRQSQYCVDRQVDRESKCFKQTSNAQQITQHKLSEEKNQQKKGRKSVEKGENFKKSPEEAKLKSRSPKQNKGTNSALKSSLSKIKAVGKQSGQKSDLSSFQANKQKRSQEKQDEDMKTVCQQKEISQKQNQDQQNTEERIEIKFSQEERIKNLPSFTLKKDKQSKLQETVQLLSEDNNSNEENKANLNVGMKTFLSRPSTLTLNPQSYNSSITKHEWGYVIDTLKESDVICKIEFTNQGKTSDQEIKKGDFLRLDPEVYLNDMIINFYLNTEKSSTVHICSTFFMSKLYNMNSVEINEFRYPSAKPQIDYAGVRRWTRSIDLFSKEYIFVPICQNEHWSIAVVCFPQRLATLMNDHAQQCLNGGPPAQPQQQAQNLAQPLKQSLEKEKQKKSKQELRQQMEERAKRFKVQHDNDSENEDESDDNEYSNEYDEEYDEEMMDIDEGAGQERSSNEDNANGIGGLFGQFPGLFSSNSYKKPAKVDDSKPYILYFDSMGDENSSTSQQIAKALRQYMEAEYLDKKLGDKKAQYEKYFQDSQFQWTGLNDSNMPFYVPRLPKQKNAYDCGLFLLEYAECFLKNPQFIESDLQQHKNQLFRQRAIQAKREILKRLIICLAKNKQQPGSTANIGKEYRDYRETIMGKLTFLNREERRLYNQTQFKTPTPSKLAQLDGTSLTQNLQSQLNL
eukprot:403361508